MQFDASALTNDDLVVLEGTLRVQVEVAKHVAIMQMTAAVGGAVLSGGLSAVLSAPSVVYSVRERKKCKERYRLCREEMEMREILIAPVQEDKLAKRAMKLRALGAGVACCVLGVAMDLCVDDCVVQVMCDFFDDFFNGKMVEGIAAFVEIRAAAMVAQRQQQINGKVMSVEELEALFPEEKKNKKKEKLKWKKEKKTGNSVWRSKSWSVDTTKFADKANQQLEKFHQKAQSLSSLSWRRWPSVEKEESLECDDNDADDNDDNPMTLFGPRSSNLTKKKQLELRRHVDKQVEILKYHIRGAVLDCFVVRAKTPAADRTSTAESNTQILDDSSALEMRQHGWPSFYNSSKQEEDQKEDDFDAFSLFGPPVRVMLSDCDDGKNNEERAEEEENDYLLFGPREEDAYLLFGPMRIIPEPKNPEMTEVAPLIQERQLFENDSKRTIHALADDSEASMLFSSMKTAEFSSANEAT